MIYDHENEIIDKSKKIINKINEALFNRVDKKSKTLLKECLNDLDDIVYNASMYGSERNKLEQDNITLINKIGELSGNIDHMSRLLEESYDEISKLRRIKKG